MESSTLDLVSYSNAVPTPTSSRKRKREDEKVVLGDAFVIGPYSSSVFDSSLKLTPAVALPRSFIPLQWLAGAPSRLFSFANNLPVLEVPGNVLIAKVDGERQLAAVEKIQDGVYAVFKLSTQLKMKDVRKTVALAKKAPHEPVSLGFGGSGDGRLGSEWWSQLKITDCSVKDLLSSPDTVGTLAMGSPDTEPLRNNPASLQTPSRVPVCPSSDVGTGAEEFASPKLSDILENTRKQYFKTLYIAKTSLAYFAKSTLSRARVAVRGDGTETSTAPSGELITFLQSMLLPFEKMDLKFRSVIPQIALEEKVDGNEVLRAGEEEYIQEWRFAAFQDKLVRAGDQSLKRRVEELKIRETELQIILLLEMMSLQREQVTPADEAGNKHKAPKKSGGSSKRKGKNKSKTGAPNYPLLLDLLVDRLCIWRSIGSVSEGPDEEPSEEKLVMDKERDHLRHFCVEVVLAFYASKLPEECKSINKKCGGRSSSSTARGSKDASISNKDKRKFTKKAPSLTRSITAPAATPTREASVDNLAALVAADAASLSKTTVRGGTLNSKSFVKRQVQISSKVVQKKKVDEELKEAIDALKKPNRVAVAAEIVEDAKKRLTTNSNRSILPEALNTVFSANPGQGPRKVPGNPLANIQVMATPKQRRTIKPQQSLPPLLEDESDAAPQDAFLPPISSSRGQFEVESTPLRPLQKRKMMEEDGVPSTSPFGTPQENAPGPSLNFAQSMFVTPKKKPRSMGTDLGAGNSIVLSTPRNNSGLSRSLSCSAVGSIPVQTPGSSPDGGVKLFGTISETPIKQNVPVGSASGGKEISIYDSLGWNDDYEL